MEISTISSRFPIGTRIVAKPISQTRSSGRTLNVSNGLSVKATLTYNFIAPFVGGSVTGDFSGQKIRPVSLNPSSISTGSRGKRGVHTMVTSNHLII